MATVSPANPAASHASRAVKSVWFAWLVSVGAGARVCARAGAHGKNTIAAAKKRRPELEVWVMERLRESVGSHLATAGWATIAGIALP